MYIALFTPMVVMAVERAFCRVVPSIATEEKPVS
jgi:hypothetical protein